MDWKQAAEWSEAALTEVRRLGAEVDRLRALIKSIEWTTAGGMKLFATCPSCNGMRSEDFEQWHGMLRDERLFEERDMRVHCGHTDDCPLAHALTP